MKHPKPNPHLEYFFQDIFFSLELFELIPVDNFKENEGLVLGRYLLLRTMIMITMTMMASMMMTMMTWIER